MLFAVVFSSSASVGYTLSAAGAAPRPALQSAGAAPAAAFSGLRLAAARVRMSDEMSEEEFLAMQDAEELVDAEGNVVTQTQELSEGAKRVVRGMRSETGVEFAPWMKVDAEAIARADRERKERKARQAAQAKQLDPYAMDPQAAELGAGGGLKSKILSEDEVELNWSTGNEEGNAGFIVQRRQGGTDDFADLESFESFAPLRTKGPGGGDYTFIDDTCSPGTWVYRILDCDSTGTRSAVCQKLVEIDAQSEQTFTLIVGGVIAALALALVAAGISADPIQTTAGGRAGF